MPFRPTLWATVFTIPVLAVLVGLGTWQLDRLSWKRDLIETRAERIVAPPLALADALQSAERGSLEALEYRPIAVRGRYLHDRAMRLQNRVRDGMPGIHLIVPLEVADGGPTVMVDRGWLPHDAESDLPAELERVVEVSGYVRLYHEPGAFVPDNEPANNVWFYMERDAMSRSAGVEETPRFYIQAGPQSGARGALPIGSVPTVDLRNSHLQYAVTWYGLAVVLVVIYVVYHWRRERRSA